MDYFGLNFCMRIIYLEIRCSGFLYELELVTFGYLVNSFFSVLFTSPPAGGSAGESLYK
jgi:hypothetical protein